MLALLKIGFLLSVLISLLLVELLLQHQSDHKAVSPQLRSIIRLGIHLLKFFDDNMWIDKDKSRYLLVNLQLLVSIRVLKLAPP